MSRSAAARGSASGVVNALPVASRDEGFTFVELLVALSLLLITLIAVTGLSMTSSFMATTARQKAAMVNASAGYLERVRQEAYGSIGTPSGDPIGDLAPVTSASSPFTVTITPQVTWGRPEDPTNRDFKTVTLSVASANASGGSLMSYSTAAVFADVGAVGATASQATTPSVSFSSPPDNSVVYGNAVSVVASATANSSSRSLVWLDVLDGVTSWGTLAVTGSTLQHTYSWNTTSVREGNHRLTPRITDSGSVTVNGTPMTLTVDNAAPGLPTSPSGAFPTGTTGQLWWTAATDGTDVDGTTPLIASHYTVSLYRQPASTALASDYTQWSPVTGLTGLSVLTAPTSVSPLALTGLAGFSRYSAAVWSSSPDRGAAPGLVSAPVTVVGVTHSTASGTWKAAFASKKYTITVSVTVPTGPTFPWTSTCSTKIYRLTSPTQAISTGKLLTVTNGSSTSPTWKVATASDSQVTKSNALPVEYYYGAITTIVPTGYGSVSTLVSSCVLGPPAVMTTIGTQPLVFAQW